MRTNCQKNGQRIQSKWSLVREEMKQETWRNIFTRMVSGTRCQNRSIFAMIEHDTDDKMG